MKFLEKKLDENYTKMLYAFLKKSWKQHSIKQQLCGYLPLMLQVILEKWASWLTSKYIHEFQFWADTVCDLEHITSTMADRDG